LELYLELRRFRNRHC